MIYFLLKIITWGECIIPDQLPPKKENQHRDVFSNSVLKQTLINMSLATKSTTSHHTIVPQSADNQLQLPSPVSVSANVTKNHNFRIPSNFRVGDSVVIFSSRENRTKYNGLTGEVCAVVWPGDRTRSIIYVKVGKMQPCFFESELKNAPAPQAVEEGVQSCL